MNPPGTIGMIMLGILLVVVGVLTAFQGYPGDPLHVIVGIFAAVAGILILVGR